MALSQSDLSELLDALRAGGDVDLIRSSVEMVLQALIDAEATEVIGAGRHERTRESHEPAQRHPPEAVDDEGRRCGVRDPEAASREFLPVAFLERRRRIDRALFAVVMEAYVHGVSHPQGR